MGEKAPGSYWRYRVWFGPDNFLDITSPDDPEDMLETTAVVPTLPGYFLVTPIYPSTQEPPTAACLSPVVAWRIAGKYSEPIGVDSLTTMGEWAVVQPDGQVVEQDNQVHADVDAWLASVRETIAMKERAALLK